MKNSTNSLFTGRRRSNTIGAPDQLVRICRNRLPFRGRAAWSGSEQADCRVLAWDELGKHPAIRLLRDASGNGSKLFSENLGLCYRRLHGLDYRGLRLSNINGPGTTTHGYLEYTNRAIEESIAGRAYSVYVEPHVSSPRMNQPHEFTALI